MANTTKDLIARPYGAGGRTIHLPVDGGEKIYVGSLVSQLTATAMLVPGSTASSGPAVGVAEHTVDNTAGNDEDLRCAVTYDKVFELENDGGDPFSEDVQLFTVAYMVDDHTVSTSSSGGARQPAGRFVGMSEDGRVRVFVGMNNLSDQLADATDVGIADAGGFTTESDVEGALQEIYQALLTSQASVLFSLHSLREVDANGDVGNIAANGGLLASDTTPILRADAAESEEVSWAATNVDAVQLQTSIPSDFDGTGAVTVELDVYTGNTNADAASFTVESSWDGAAKVSDAATDAAPSGTVHTVTATIAAADIPDAARRLTLTLIPGAHGTDPVNIVGIRLNYKRKLLTS